eukprot:scaffold17019_cov54-Phaeocystis_antarctica.AAC.1
MRADVGDTDQNLRHNVNYIPPSPRPLVAFGEVVTTRVLPCHPSLPFPYIRAQRGGGETTCAAWGRLVLRSQPLFYIFS